MTALRFGKFGENNINPTHRRPVALGRALQEVKATTITLYGFGRVFRPVIGETKDLRVQWALEEVGLPYRVHGLDHTGGELDGPAYSEISCFHLVPAIDDDGFTVANPARCCSTWPRGPAS